MSARKHPKEFELWIEKFGYKFFESTNTTVREMLEVDAKLIWKTQALTWQEAQHNKDAFLGMNKQTNAHSIEFDNTKITVKTDDISDVINLIKSCYAAKH